ncbi:unnamed protein product, partial [Allacma fusca]
FIARRGKPSHIFSDNGSNFVGADRELKEMLQVVISAEVNEAAKRMLQEDGISWKFNPAAAPHMGGIWEAGIKSTKFHLKRVVGTGSLTYEELQTILVQIEGCLNSRPLCPNTADPNQPAALTPAETEMVEATAEPSKGRYSAAERRPVEATDVETRDY